MTVTAERTAALDHLVVADPAGGEVVHVRAGSRLEVTFARRGLGSAAWQVAERPGNVVPIGPGGWALHFIVFDRPADAAYRPLRLVRTRMDGGGAVETRDLDVVVSP
jgi:hypothetical protein